MAARVTWSWQSLDDIEAIADYIARDSTYYAQAVVEAVLGLEEGIGQFPQAGRVVPEFADPNVRERFVYSYRVIYEVRLDNVEVLTVIHGKRLLED